MKERKPYARNGWLPVDRPYLSDFLGVGGASVGIATPGITDSQGHMKTLKTKLGLSRINVRAIWHRCTQLNGFKLPHDSRGIEQIRPFFVFFQNKSKGIQAVLRCHWSQPFIQCRYEVVDYTATWMKKPLNLQYWQEQNEAQQILYVLSQGKF